MLVIFLIRNSFVIDSLDETTTSDAVFNYTQFSVGVEKNLPECQSELIHVLLPVLRAPTMQRRRPTQTAQASVTLGVSGAGCNVTQCGISEQAQYSYFH